MELKEFLKIERPSYQDFLAYVTHQGIENIKTDDLNKIIQKTKGDILNFANFDFIYNIVSSNESNKVITKWTITTGVLTIIVTVATIVNLFLFAGTL